MRYLLLICFLSWNTWAESGNIHQDRLSPSAQIDFRLLKNYGSSQLSSTLREDLTKSHLDPSLKNPKSTSTTVKAGSNRTVSFSEGTGTRGGGSGVLITGPQRNPEVQLLDVYRSARRDRFPLFFEIDPELIHLSASLDAKSAADQIYIKVMERAKNIFPHLIEKISFAEKVMPFKKWVPTVSALPLIDDFLGELETGKDQTHVQIAYRRNDQVIYNEELLAAMDGLNRAALRLHEYIYAVSSEESSIQTQRLVSLLMSSKLPSVMSKASGQNLLFELGLSWSEMTPAKLPPGAHIDNKARPQSSETCGLLTEMTFNQADPSISIKIKVEPNQLQITRHELTPGDFLSMKFSKLESIILRGNEMVQFFLAMHFAKSYMQTQYPYFLYPAQSNPSDIICFNQMKNRVSSLDTAIQYHKIKSEADLEGSRLEAEYFKAHRKYSLEPSKESAENFLKAEHELKTHSLDFQAYENPNQFHKLKLILESEELIGLKLRLDP